MTTPAPHEPCCECFACQNCSSFPAYFAASITGVLSTAQCDVCEDANEQYGLGKIPCENLPCGWYAFGHCQNLGHDSCGHVRLIELDITWTLVAGQLVTTVGLSIELDSGSSYWEQEFIGPINCYGGFTFTANDLVSNGSDCDYSEATIELSGCDEDPCFPPP